MAGLMVAAGCAGLFQRRLPDAPAQYSRNAGVGELKVGFAERDVTPVDLPYLAGFDLARRATGVHSKLMARAMVLVAGGVRLAIIGVDNLGLMRDDVDWIKTGIGGFANGNVFVCSSHTHAGPDPIGIWGFYYLTSGRDPAYFTRLRKQIAGAVADALAAARPATLHRGSARLPREGFVRNSNISGVFDRRFTVLEARDAASRRTLGALLHMACHPEVLRRRNTLISSDFAGALCERWRAEGHGQAVFVNGALGAMVSPHPNGVDGITTMVDGLWAVAARARKSLRPAPVEAIEIRRRDLYMPLTSPGLLFGRLATVIPRRAYENHMRTGVGYLRIGEIEIACVPGEMEPGLAEEVRRELRKPDLLIFGLCDDEVGYLMREQDARRPDYSYERIMSPEVMAGEKVRAALTGLR